MYNKASSAQQNTSIVFYSIMFDDICGRRKKSSQQSEYTHTYEACEEDSSRPEEAKLVKYLIFVNVVVYIYHMRILLMGNSIGMKSFTLRS